MNLTNRLQEESFITLSFRLLEHLNVFATGKEPRKKKAKKRADSNDMAKVQNKWMKLEEQGQ